MMLVGIIVLLISIIIHEVAHGYVAYKLGDPTAKFQGRLSLNPIRHLDPIGSILLPGILLVTNAPFLFGWAKPVPFNPYNLKNPKRDEALIAFAGPVSNIALALLAAGVVRLIEVFSLVPPLFVIEFLFSFTIINLVLAVFNLIPIPPLDGSKILFSVLPEKFTRIRHQIEGYGFILIFILIYTGALGFVFTITSKLTLFLLGWGE